MNKNIKTLLSIGGFLCYNSSVVTKKHVCLFGVGAFLQMSYKVGIRVKSIRKLINQMEVKT